MRITTITTDEQRIAVLHAAEAATLVADRLPGAHLIELAAQDCPEGIIRAYDLFQVWPAPVDSPQLWCDHVPYDGWEPAGKLTDEDVDRIQWLLRAAGEADPNVFDPGELAATAWQLDIPKVLAVAEYDAVGRLLNHYLHDLGGDLASLNGFVAEQVEQTPPGDLSGDMGLLLRTLGERETWHALETI